MHSTVKNQISEITAHTRKSSRIFSRNPVNDVEYRFLSDFRAVRNESEARCKNSCEDFSFQNGKRHLTSPFLQHNHL